jgi:hypothetical protein
MIEHRGADLMETWVLLLIISAFASAATPPATAVSTVPEYKTEEQCNRAGSILVGDEIGRLKQPQDAQLKIEFRCFPGP